MFCLKIIIISSYSDFISLFVQTKCDFTSTKIIATRAGPIGPRETHTKPVSRGWLFFAPTLASFFVFEVYPNTTANHLELLCITNYFKYKNQSYNNFNVTVLKQPC